MRNICVKSCRQFLEIFGYSNGHNKQTPKLYSPEDCQMNEGKCEIDASVFNDIVVAVENSYHDHEWIKSEISTSRLRSVLLSTFENISPHILCRDTDNLTGITAIGRAK